MAVQDIRVGGRQSNASYQYTLLSDDLSALREWEPKIRKALAALPELADVNSDQQDNGAEMDTVYDRDTMSRLGISVEDANNLLNNAFGQRQISTIYQPLNQYKVVMEVDPAYTRTSAPRIRCSSLTATASRSRWPTSPNGSRPMPRCR